MLGCVVAGMGAALLPKSILRTFPESRRLRIHRLSRGQNRIATVLIWRKGAGAAKIKALQDILTGPTARRRSHRRAEAEAAQGLLAVWRARIT
jgi:DNA-binding transcriptional LysR family regulator